VCYVLADNVHLRDSRALALRMARERREGKGPSMQKVGQWSQGAASPVGPPMQCRANRPSDFVRERGQSRLNLASGLTNGYDSEAKVRIWAKILCSVGRLIKAWAPLGGFAEPSHKPTLRTLHHVALRCVRAPECQFSGRGGPGAPKEPLPKGRGLGGRPGQSRPSFPQRRGLGRRFSWSKVTSVPCLFSAMRGDAR
jgi:hypothetical protein